MATTNNCLNNKIPSSTANQTKTFVVSNSDNTGTSAAQMQISVGGGTTSGDPQESYIISGANTWSIGGDNSINDQFTIAHNAALGTSNTQTITTSGQVNLPLHPCFLAYLTTNKTNATGAGVKFIVGSSSGFTIVFDRGSNITTSTGTFTAPITGTYMFIGQARLSNCTINTGIQIAHTGSAGGHTTGVRTFQRAAASTDMAMNFSEIVQLISGNTVNLWVTGTGEASATETLLGGNSPMYTYWAGYLMC